MSVQHEDVQIGATDRASTSTYWAAYMVVSDLEEMKSVIAENWICGYLAPDTGKADPVECGISTSGNQYPQSSLNELPAHLRNPPPYAQKVPPASRLAAAYNHGFIDKPMAEVGDVVRMILTAKEDLANNPVKRWPVCEYRQKTPCWMVAQPGSIQRHCQRRYQRQSQTLQNASASRPLKAGHPEHDDHM